MRIAVSNSPDDSSSEGSLLDGVEVVLEAYLGKAKLRIADVRGLKADSVVTLDTTLGAMVELRLNGASVARGELVAVGDNFGVRITEIGK